MIRGVKNSYSEMYTLTESEKLIDLQRARKSRMKARERWYFIKQKLCGVVLLACGGVIPMIDKDAGMPAVFSMLLGIALIVSKDKMMFWG